MSWFQPVATMVSSGLQAYGQYLQGKQEQAAYEYEAKAIEQAGKLEVYKIGKEKEIATGIQRAAYARANVLLKGSPLDVMLNTASNYEFEKLVTKYNIEQEANLKRYYGRTAMTTAKYKMGMTLLGGAIKMMDYLPTSSTPQRGTTGGPATTSYGIRVPSTYTPTW
jgi:hypothetical protein